MSPLKVAVLAAEGAAEPPPLDPLRAVADVHVAESLPQLAAALDGAEVLVVWDTRTELLKEAWPHARALRWIHTPSIGVDAVMIDEVVFGEVVVTNTRGVFERPVAEFVLALLLLFAKDLPRTLELQRRREWRQRRTELVRGRRVLIVGAGHIARELAPLARGADMEVDVVGRTACAGDAVLGTVHGVADIDALLPQADDVVLALPLTSETRRFLDADRIGRIRRGARIVNIGRGALIDDEALIGALRDGRIAAAGLDAFDPEPLPPDHPYWGMEQVVVCPHMSSVFAGWEEQVVELFAQNLRRWQAGESLHDVIDKASFRTAAPMPEA
jgi:phosphoglycerate dehydrogenase-like enzyme